MATTSTRKNSFWTPRNVERLLKWHDKLKGKKDAMKQIASKMNKSSDSVYKKLGRLGKIDASWSSKYCK
jgi:hypothetical protein